MPFFLTHFIEWECLDIGIRETIADFA